MHQSIRLGTGGIDGCIILTCNMHIHEQHKTQAGNESCSQHGKVHITIQLLIHPTTTNQQKFFLKFCFCLFVYLLLLFFFFMTYNFTRWLCLVRRIPCTITIYGRIWSLSVQDFTFWAFKNLLEFVQFTLKFQHYSS